MALANGTRLGPYQITAPLGAGGMGEVYRATDTRLKRDVAVKVLPAEVAGDPERLARFQREAEVLASLNHPNIAGIYGFEDTTVTTGSGPAVAKALVMELVEGPTLAERIVAGAMPPDEVLPIATQMADGLEAAHGQGIVHRDLKPANVKLRPDGTVKVLDFGLAKPPSAGAAASSVSMAPTIAPPATTMQGLIVGTAAYMSPEQARGRHVDRRTDVWAFGAVLFEMLTGTKPFPGDDVSQVMARVIEREPDWSLLPRTTPPGMRQAVEICLRKDLRERAGDLSAVRLAMQGAFVSAALPAGAVSAGSQERRVTSMAAVAAALVIGVVAGAIGWSATPPAPPAPPLARFEITTPPDGPIVANSGLGKVSISPDGTRIAYASAAGQGNASLQIYVRGLGELEPSLLRGTEGGGTYPFFSPDGQSIGFVDVTQNAIKRVSVLGGPAQTIATFDRLPLGMEWAPDDTILFSLDRGSGLMRVSSGGGEVQAITKLREGDGVHALPDVLPGGEYAVLTIVAADSVFRLAVVELATGEITDLGLEGTAPKYSPTGHIVYSAENTLRAVGFDAASLTLTTRVPVPVVENVIARGGLADFGLSANGSIVYLSGTSAAPPRTLVWMDRSGRQETVGVAARQYQTPRVSPDGTRVAVAVDGDIWVTELARPGTLRRITTDEDLERYPLWSRDGQRLFFESSRTGAPGIFSIAADGRGDVEDVLTDGPAGTNLLSPGAWTADGRMVFVYRSAAGDLDFGTLAVDGSGSWRPLLDTRANEASPVVSPDGQWIAYEADDTGQYEIYVERLPALGGRQIVSTGGGRHPAWSSDGGALFFRRGSGGGGPVMVSAIQSRPVFTPAAAQELGFGAEQFGAPGPRTFDVARDGRLLLMQTVEIDASARARIVLVQRWIDELRARVPVP